MKKYLLLASAVGVIALQGCEKVKELAKVDIGMEQSDIEFTIPAIPATGEQTLGAIEVPVNIDSFVRTQNGEATAAKIRSVHLKSCVITMENGDAANNFANLQAASAKFSSDTKQEMVTVAELTNNPDVEAYTLELPVKTDVDLKDYFNSSKFTYHLSGNARRTTSKELKCKAVVKYTITVGL